MKLLGRKAKFIPSQVKDKNGGAIKWDPTPVDGVVDRVHAGHGWFAVAYRAGETLQHECFQLCEIGTAVTLLGRR